MKITLLIITLGLLYLLTNQARSTGRPGEYSGGAGDYDCSTCHFGELGGAVPEVTIKGLNERVPGGSVQNIILEIFHADMVVAGLQASIRAVGDEPDGAGILKSGQLNTFMNDGIAFLNHPEPLMPENGRITINLSWDVPRVSERAVLLFTLLAANGDYSPFGDSVVKIERQVSIETGQ